MRSGYTKDDVERFEGEMGKLVILKQALELALINPRLSTDQKQKYTRALIACDSTLRRFRRLLIATVSWPCRKRIQAA